MLDPRTTKSPIVTLGGRNRGNIINVPMSEPEVVCNVKNLKVSITRCDQQTTEDTRQVVNKDNTLNKEETGILIEVDEDSMSQDEGDSISMPQPSVSAQVNVTDQSPKLGWQKIIPKFSGVANNENEIADAASWLQRFERVAELMNLTEDDGTKIVSDKRATYLPLYLKHGSPADTFYNNLSREVQKNYELLKTELIERFPVIPGTRVAGLIQYNTRKLQPGESIDQYIDHMQKIGTSLGKTEADTADMVKLGLPDKIKAFVLEKEANTLADISKYAKLSQAIAKTTTVNEVDVMVTALGQALKDNKLQVTSVNKVEPVLQVGTTQPQSTQGEASQRPNPQSQYDEMNQWQGPKWQQAQQYQPVQQPRWQNQMFQQQQQNWRPQWNQRTWQNQPRGWQRGSEWQNQQGRTGQYNQQWQRMNNSPRNTGMTQNSRSDMYCTRCNSSAHNANSCPHQDKACFLCHQIGHLAKLCRNARFIYSNQGRK